MRTRNSDTSPNSKEEEKMLGQRNHRAFFRIGFLWILLVCLAMPSAVFAGRDNHKGAALVGTWRVTVNPDTPAEVFVLLVFHADRTMTATTSTIRQSIGSGVWKKTHRNDVFTAEFEFFVDSDWDGEFDVRARIRPTIELLDRDTYSATNTFELFTLDGNTMIAGPFTTISEGTRMR